MLRRSVLSCLLWEEEFYEDGKTIADRIVEYAEQVHPKVLAELAIDARSKFNLRHVPLLLLTALVRKSDGPVHRIIHEVIQRPDELGELLTIYWRNGRQPISAQLRKGLKSAFRKFNEYSLAKYDRDDGIKLRDVMRMVRPKPVNKEQADLFKRVITRTLKTPDTWEVALSGGADKKATFERLIREGQLGYLALLRNLRNMAQAGVDPNLVVAAIIARKGAERVLPFRYVAAARAAPQYEAAIDQALVEAIADIPALPGKTVVLVDVSGSMDDKLSGKSDMKRIDAAATLASIIPGDLRVFSFSDYMVEVPPRRGMAGVDAVITSQPHHGTALFEAIDQIHKKVPHNRLIVITDEQAGNFGMSRMPDPVCKHAYVINVASARNGVGYGKWTHIDGFSEGVLRFIRETENAA
jgi:hypothetical protein